MICTYRTPVERSDTGDILDSLGSVVQFSQNFLVGQGSHRLVGPCVTSNVVAILNTAESAVGPVDDVGADVEHGSLLVVLLQKVVEGIMRAVWTVIECLSKSKCRKNWKLASGEPS